MNKVIRAEVGDADPAAQLAARGPDANGVHGPDSIRPLRIERLAVGDGGVTRGTWMEEESSKTRTAVDVGASGISLGAKPRASKYGR